MKLGERIQYLRKEKGYSQEEFANLLNIGRSTLANYEQCKRDPSYDTIEMIAKKLDVSPAYLMGWIDKKGDIIGLKKKPLFPMVFSFDDTIDIVKMDQFQLYSSGIFQTYKDNQKSYYKWYSETNSDLNNYINCIEKSINYYSSLVIPFYNIDKEYYISQVKEYLDDLHSLLNQLLEINDHLEDLLYKQNNEMEMPEINNLEEKRKYLLQYLNQYDFSNLTDEKIEDYFNKFIIICKQENEKFKKVLKSYDNMNI